MKRPYLVLYDYGMGGVWAYILARSPEEIGQEYPELVVYDQPPDFLTPTALNRIETTLTIDIDDRGNPFLAELVKERQRG
jgi:hypothetical protein